MTRAKMKESGEHKWHFIQTGGLVQVQISSIEDILNLRDLDQKLWIALSCPVKGLEFSEETLTLLDIDKNGRVRVPEILAAIDFLRKYLKKPEIIMEKGDAIPLDALGEEPFSCGYSPLESAKSVLNILGKNDAYQISFADISLNEKLFAPSIVNGDGVVPPEAAGDDFTAGVLRDMISATGGVDDISGAKGVNRAQTTKFFDDARALQAWKNSVKTDDERIFFLGGKTDSAADAYMKIKDKIDEYFLRCSIASFNDDVSTALKKKEESAVSSVEKISSSSFSALPIAPLNPEKLLSFGDSINPAWEGAVDSFLADVIIPIFGEGKTSLSESEWMKIQDSFAPYMAWHSARPENSASAFGIDRVMAILSSDAEKRILVKLDEEDKHPPISFATADLRKLILYRRDLVELLKNFVSFENFYSLDEWAVFQCGTLYIDGRSCDMCFRVLDSAKHAGMSPLSQCFLLYCDCKRPSENRTMQIAAMLTSGGRDNLIVGRNGLFYDRAGNDWDATITKIIENPISIREAFWSPYRKLMRMIQERVAKSAIEAENSITSKMSAAVENPSSLGLNANNGNGASGNANSAGTGGVSGGIGSGTANSSGLGGAAAAMKKFDVGTIAAISVACTGLATVVGGLLSAFFGLGYWIPLGVLGIILAISLPSMFIAWSKLRQRNIAPILDASGWAVNGNVKINIPLGNFLTHTGVRPKGSKFTAFDPYEQKKFPVKRAILLCALLAGIVWFAVKIFKNPDGLSGVIFDIKTFCAKVLGKFKAKSTPLPQVSGY